MTRVWPFFPGFVGEGCEEGGARGEVGSVDEGLVLVGSDDEDDYTAGAVIEDWLAGECRVGGGGGSCCAIDLNGLLVMADEIVVDESDRGFCWWLTEWEVGSQWLSIDAVDVKVVDSSLSKERESNVLV
jgi:hypothetical protein